MSPATRLPRPRRPVGQSMALLTDLMEHPLDRSYQDRADAREARGEPAVAGSRSTLLLVSCVVLGLLLVVAAQTLRVSEDRASGQRAQLVDQIERRQKANSGAQKTVADLRSQISGMRTTTGGDGDPEAQLARTQVAAGTVPLTGPGVVMTLDDRVGAERRDGSDPRDPQGPQEVLTSHDLQIMVNGLWQSGAEAISINGYRLTSLSAIRFAGEAILVDFRPIARPYVITAIGEQGGLWTTFRDGSGGTYLESLKRSIDMDVSVDTDGEVEVPASDSVALREARPKDAEPSSQSLPSAAGGAS